MLSLLDRARREAELFVILGDLFDIWVGEGRAFQKEYAPLIEKFRELARSARVIYFEGNHDFHLRRFWQDVLHCEVLTGPTEIEFQGLKIWAEHGDEINQRDKGYLLLRKVLRLPPVRRFIENFPSRIIMEVGARASHTSRKYKKDPSDIVSIFRQYAAERRAGRDFDLLLTGHSHAADDYSSEMNGKKFRLINLGSWFDGPHFLKISGGAVEVVSL